MEVTIKLPEHLARTFGDTPDGVGRRLLENAAIEGYRVGELSQRDVGEMLGLDYWQTEKLLAEHRVPLNYDAGDLEADRVALDKILGNE